MTQAVAQNEPEKAAEFHVPEFSKEFVRNRTSTTDSPGPPRYNHRNGTGEHIVDSSGVAHNGRETMRPKRTSIGVSRMSRFRNKQKRRQAKHYRGQGRPC